MNMRYWFDTNIKQSLLFFELPFLSEREILFLEKLAKEYIKSPRPMSGELYEGEWLDAAELFATISDISLAEQDFDGSDFEDDEEDED